CPGLSLDPGATLAIQFRIRPNVAGSVTYGASVVGSTFPNNAANDTEDVAPGATDVQVTGSSNNGSPPVGSTFNYTFQVKNNGPIPAGGITFDDTVPAALQLVGNPTSDIGSCTANTVSNSVHCDIANLGVGEQSTISFA